MSSRQCSILAAAVAMCAGAAQACDFMHGEAGGDRGQHANLLGDGGYTTLSNSNTPSLSYNVNFLSQMTLPQLGGGAGSSLWGWVDPQTNREYAIMGRSTGTSFVDVTNPRSPVLVANLPPVSATANSNWREPKVIGNYVYVGVDGVNHGVQVMNLERLRNYAGSTMTMTSDAIYGYTGSGSTTGLLTRSHTLAIETMGGYSNTPTLFVAGSNMQSGGIHAINVSNPLAPTFAGGFSADGYTHEMQVVNYNGPDTAYQGRQIAFAYNVDTVTIVDTTNKSAMTQIGRTVQPQRGYVHQGWLTPDQRYLISNDELDERNGLTGGKMRTHFWDVSDLNNPEYRGFYEHNQGNVDHNLYVVGDLLFESNYTMGLQVFKIGELSDLDPQNNLVRVAQFDTYAPNNGNSFNGSWNNYPFFPSGNIAISDINGGLIMLRLSQKAIPELQLESSGQLSPHQLLSGYNTAAFNAYRASVPEPAAMSLIGACAALVLRRRR